MPKRSNTRRNKKQKTVILILEDEEPLLQAITKKLELSGFETVSTTTGSQAIDYLENMDRLPDVIWLDYYLKDTNGIEFMNELKKNKKWKNIPVIVVSNSASDKKIHTMLALGAKKYVLKAEHRLEDIIQMVEDFI